MGQYVVYDNAYTNSTANTYDNFIQLVTETNYYVAVKRIFISFPSSYGNLSPNALYNFTLQFRTLSASVSGGVTATPQLLNTLSTPASLSTVTVKIGSTAFPVGVSVNVFGNVNINELLYYDWRALSEQEAFYFTGVFSIVAESNGVSRPLYVELEWDE